MQLFQDSPRLSRTEQTASHGVHDSPASSSTTLYLHLFSRLPHILCLTLSELLPCIKASCSLKTHFLFSRTLFPGPYLLSCFSKLISAYLQRGSLPSTLLPEMTNGPSLCPRCYLCWSLLLMWLPCIVIVVYFCVSTVRMGTPWTYAYNAPYIFLKKG